MTPRTTTEVQYHINSMAQSPEVFHLFAVVVVRSLFASYATADYFGRATDNSEVWHTKGKKDTHQD